MRLHSGQRYFTDFSVGVPLPNVSLTQKSYEIHAEGSHSYTLHTCRLCAFRVCFNHSSNTDKDCISVAQNIWSFRVNPVLSFEGRRCRGKEPRV
ncbi:hypothetical protein GYH30_039975 [Glycine max]|uniref:Uncharacterized protein n=1 Tax=Glycine max TaxID=3847 RepID=K7M6S5_SOYBN|nr:hypothetical protein GYH30_039975 [Glycine max]